MCVRRCVCVYVYTYIYIYICMWYYTCSRCAIFCFKRAFSCCQVSRVSGSARGCCCSLLVSSPRGSGRPNGSSWPSMLVSSVWRATTLLCQERFNPVVVRCMKFENVSAHDKNIQAVCANTYACKYVYM